MLVHRHHEARTEKVSRKMKRLKTMWEVEAVADAVKSLVFPFIACFAATAVFAYDPL